MHVSWDGYGSDVFINPATKTVHVYETDFPDLHSSFGGQLYYQSRSGLSGSGWFPDDVPLLRVGYYVVGKPHCFQGDLISPGTHVFFPLEKHGDVVGGINPVVVTAAGNQRKLLCLPVTMFWDWFFDKESQSARRGKVIHISCFPPESTHQTTVPIEISRNGFHLSLKKFLKHLLSCFGPSDEMYGKFRRTGNCILDAAGWVSHEGRVYHFDHELGVFDMYVEDVNDIRPGQVIGGGWRMSDGYAWRINRQYGKIDIVGLLGKRSFIPARLFFSMGEQERAVTANSPENWEIEEAEKINRSYDEFVRSPNIKFLETITISSADGDCVAAASYSDLGLTELELAETIRREWGMPITECQIRLAIGGTGTHTEENDGTVMERSLVVQ